MARTRISKIAKDLNIAVSTAVEFLRKKNIEIDDNPNTRIEDNIVDLLIDEFDTDGTQKAKKAGKKIERWQAISESAAKQSKRTLIPEVQMPLTWKEAMKKAQELDVVLVPYECERGMETTREVIKWIQPGQSIAIFIGPEGGFSPDEIEGICPTNEGQGFSQELEEKSHRISLGRRILRTETAGLATLAMLIFCLDE